MKPGAKFVTESWIGGIGFLQIGDGERQDGGCGLGAEIISGSWAGYFAVLFQAGITVEKEAGGIEDAIGGFLIKPIVKTFAIPIAENGVFGKGVFFSMVDDLDVGATQKVIQPEFISLAVEGVTDGMPAELFGVDVDAAKGGRRGDGIEY